ncbi:MAG: hypothetical protein K9W44_08960 [Candidatus Lokiarchaeota archaeon]|nr:hypothetical protein [Candidatus Harpocratesius repetitus]
MRTNIVLDPSQQEIWWEIKRTAKNLKMTIGEYFIFCHQFRKNQKEEEELEKLLENPLMGGKKDLDLIGASKSMWKT